MISLVILADMPFDLLWIHSLLLKSLLDGLNLPLFLIDEFLLGHFLLESIVNGIHETRDILQNRIICLIIH